MSALLLGCKYGGSDEDPLAGYEPEQPVEPGALDAAGEADGEEEKPPTAKPSESKADAARSMPQDAGSSSSASMCAPTIAACDPVRNTGCPPLMQCDIDPSATTPTGRCVFQSNPDGGQCTSSFVNVGCAAQNTCVAGQCRKMCYCDGDCPAGQTCSDASGPGPAGAFKLCR